VSRAFWLGLALSAAATARGADWRTIEPSRTAEAEILEAFGPPAMVTASYSWKEWNARQRGSGYVLHYLDSTPDNPILGGPAGPAEAADVQIGNGNVVAVTWSYFGAAKARAAASLLRADPELKFNSPKAPCYAWKPGPHGRLFVEIGGEAGPVKVTYDLK
jgi:hypothetical protein